MAPGRGGRGFDPRGFFRPAQRYDPVTEGGYHRVAETPTGHWTGDVFTKLAAALGQARQGGARRRDEEANVAQQQGARRARAEELGMTPVELQYNMNRSPEEFDAMLDEMGAAQRKTQEQSSAQAAEQDQTMRAEMPVRQQLHRLSREAGEGTPRDRVMMARDAPITDVRAETARLRTPDPDPVLTPQQKRAGTAYGTKGKQWDESGGALTPIPGAADGAPGEYGASLKDTRYLADDWQEASGDIMEIKSQYGRMEEGLKAAERGDMNFGSQAVLVTFQKILDPTSVVRESEYARSPAGQALIDNFIGKVRRVREGGPGVTIENLREAADVGRAIVARAEQGLSPEYDRIHSLAEQFRVDPKLVFGGYQPPEGGASTGYEQAADDEIMAALGL